MSFEWQTEEEGSWDAETQPAPGPTSAPRRLRSLWPTLGAVLLVILVAALLLYRQVQMQIDLTQADITEEVLASHELLQAAAGQADEELFVNVLSGREERWTAVQKLLLAHGILFSRPGLGLRWQPARQGATESVRLAPDLDEAEVRFRQTYLLTTAVGVTQTVQLAHHAIYRKGSTHWLYAPPEDAAAFWGEGRRYEGERLTVNYPARDADIGQRLAEDLDGNLIALCRRPALHCSRGWRLFLKLEGDPQLLLRFGQRAQHEALYGRLEFALPAPTLVGTPVDDSGYQALRHGYADFVLSSAIADLVGYDCCQNVLFFRALVEQQLVELGVQPALVSTSEYLALMDDFQPVAALAPLWRSASLVEATASERRLVRAFVDFLLAQGEAPVATWQEAVVRYPGFRRWLREMVGRDDLEQAWSAFALSRLQEAQAGQGEPPFPLPEQDLLLACAMDGDDDLRLVRYQTDSDTWVEEQVLGGERAALLSLPGDEKVLIYRYRAGRAAPRNLIWQPSSFFPLVSGANPGTNSLLPVSYTPASTSLDPLGQYLVLLRWNQEEPEQAGYRLFDLACANAPCSDNPFPGIPVWSPDGAQVLASNERQLWRIERSSLGEPAVELRGNLPFWLDAERYGYLSADTVLMLASVEDDESRPFVHLSQLVRLLPEEFRDQLLEIRQVLVLRDRPNALLVVAHQPGILRLLTFRIERAPDEVSFLDSSVEDDEITLLGWEESSDLPLAYLLDNGRLLLTSAIGPEGHMLTVYDITRQKKLFSTVLGGTMGAVDASADGRWLALTAEHFVELIALPRDGQPPARHFLFPPFSRCTSAAWIRDGAARN